MESKVAAEILTFLNSGGDIKAIGQEAVDFIHLWLEGGKSDLDPQKVWERLLPAFVPVKEPLFRGDTKLSDQKYQSYTPKHDIAAKFASFDGFLIVLDEETSRHTHYAFDFTSLASLLYEATEDNPEFSGYRDCFEMWCFENEFIVKTDVEDSCIYKVFKTPAYLSEGTNQ